MGAGASVEARRLVVAWSLLTGAALVLEPQPAAAVATAAWARPTVLAVPPRDLDRLLAAAEDFDRGDLPGRAGRWLRRWWGRWTKRTPQGGTDGPPDLPFRRLHTVVLDGTVSVDETVDEPPDGTVPPEEAGGDGSGPPSPAAVEALRHRGVAVVPLASILR